MDHVTSLAGVSVMQDMLEASATAVQAVTMDFHTASVSHSTYLVIVILLTELKGKLATVSSARPSSERIRELWVECGLYMPLVLGTRWHEKQWIRNISKSPYERTAWAEINLISVA